MPYSQLGATVHYPKIQTDVWVIISRLSRVPVRVVPDLRLVNHASEFALPIPTGVIPEKVVVLSEEVQDFDGLARPIYDDGSPEGTVDAVDGNGAAYPPKLITVNEERVVSLRSNPELFGITEIISIIETDFKNKFPFYNWAKLVIFDEAYDSTPIYQGQQEATGFAAGGHPLFIGPIQGTFDTLTTPRGYLMLVSPNIEGIDYYMQIRHGVAGVNGAKGPILDIEQASRQSTGGEIFRLYPLENTAITETMLTDASDTEITYFWIRSAINGRVRLERPYPVIPFLIILGRTTGGVAS